jgi:hypothetical protein
VISRINLGRLTASTRVCLSVPPASVNGLAFVFLIS